MYVMLLEGITLHAVCDMYIWSVNFLLRRFPISVKLRKVRRLVSMTIQLNLDVPLLIGLSLWQNCSQMVRFIVLCVRWSESVRLIFWDEDMRQSNRVVHNPSCHCSSPTMVICFSQMDVALIIPVVHIPFDIYQRQFWHMHDHLLRQDWVRDFAQGARRICMCMWVRHISRL